MRKASAICLLAACAAPASAASAAANGTAAAWSWPTASEMDAWGGNDTAKTTWEDDEAALGGFATLTYFKDRNCKTVGGGPPGLKGNPLSLTKGCNTILTNQGFSFFIQAISCKNNKGSVKLCPGACPQACEPVVKMLPSGVCLDQGGIYTKFVCGN